MQSAAMRACLIQRHRSIRLAIVGSKIEYCSVLPFEKGMSPVLSAILDH
jgi:hypothetical protein